MATKAYILIQTAVGKMRDIVADMLSDTILIFHCPPQPIHEGSVSSLLTAFVLSWRGPLPPLERRRN